MMSQIRDALERGKIEFKLCRLEEQKLNAFTADKMKLKCFWALLNVIKAGDERQ